MPPGRESLLGDGEDSPIDCRDEMDMKRTGPDRPFPPGGSTGFGFSGIDRVLRPIGVFVGGR
jgi:hypothetical protein